MKASLIVIVVLAIALPAAFFCLSFDTQYAPGYTERAFKSIRVGDTREQVTSLVGNPLSSYDTEPFVQWLYSGTPEPKFSHHGEASGTHTSFTFKNGLVENVTGQRRTSENSFVAGPGVGYLKLAAEDVEKLKGASPEAVKEKFGPPVATYEYKATKVLVYSRAASKSNYHLRMVGLDGQGRVVRLWKSVYWD